MQHGTRIGLLCLLLGLYALVYVGQTHSKDEDWMLSAASTFVRHGELHIESVAANEWGSSVFETEILRAFGPDGAAYTKKGLLPTIAMMPFIFISDVLPRFWSTEATVHLMNPVILALSALLIAEIGVRVGFGRGVSLAAALMFGGLTVALPYAQSVFGEPLAGLMLMLALWLTMNYHDKPTTFNALASGTAIGLTIAINPVYALFVPVIGVWLLGPDVRQWRWGHGVVFGIPAVITLLAIMGYNVLRFGDPIYSGYNLATNEGFIHPMHQGVMALLFSGYRGLMWYSPLTWLAFFGWGGLYRAHRGLAVTTLALIIVNTLSFASWWSWHGGTVWGPRFMVPIVPLLALFWLGPLTAAVRTAWVRWSIAGLALIAGFVQLVAVLYAYNPWPNMLAANYPGEHDNLASYLADDVLYTPQLSAIWGHTSYLLNGQTNFLPALLRADVWPVGVLHAAIVVLLIGLGVMLLRGVRVPLWASAPVMIAALFVLPALHPPDMLPRAQMLGQTAAPSGVVFAITDELWIEQVGRNQVVSAHAPTQPGHPYAQPRWDRALSVRPDAPFYLLTWFPPASPENWQEQHLWSNYGYVGEQWVEDNRLVRFDRRPAPLDTPHDAQFGPIELRETGIQRHDNGVSIALEWAAVEPVPADYVLFVHTLDESGAIVHQVDHMPMGGYALTSTWEPGTPIVTRYFAPVTNAAAVRVGWVNPAEGSPVPVTGQDEPFVLLPIP